VGKGGGGGGSQTTTSTFSPWDPFALKQYQSLVGGLTFGGPGGTETPYPGPYQTVAPFTQEELQGLGLEMGTIPGMESSLGAGYSTLGGALSGTPANPMMAAYQASVYGPGYTTPPAFTGPGVSAPSIGTSPTGAVGNYQNSVLGGAYLNPASNPELTAYANAATDLMGKQYAANTAPSEMSGAVLSGAFGGSSDAEARALNQYNYANAVGNTLANIYEPAYQAERGLQQQTYGTGAQYQLGAGEANAANALAASQANAANALGAYQSQLGYRQGMAGLQAGTYQSDMANQIKALGLMPQTLQAGLMPGETALGVGGLEQAQAQQGLNAQYQNAYNQNMWPYQLGSYYGGMATGINQGYGQGQQTTDFPYQNSWGQSILGGGLGLAGIGGLLFGGGQNSPWSGLMSTALGSWL
jgi:hypothetical protein